MNLADLILWHALYLLVAIAAITAVLLAGIWFDIQWCRNVFRPWDYLGAALFGGDGKHSISAYCGANNTVIHRIGRTIIDGLFGKGHCTQAALREGLLKP